MDDTIAAIATPPGEGGIGTVKISGPEAKAILQALFVPGRPGAPGAPAHPEAHKGCEEGLPLGGAPSGSGSWPARRLRYGTIRNPDTGQTVDEVLACFMPAPHTYTCQDVAEIHCHGGRVALCTVLGLVVGQGARLAEPGEMTLRAFLNGRVDLAQAEAVLGIVRASTGLGLQLAVEQLAGGLSGEVHRLRGLLLPALAHLEASIDFPDDEIPPWDVLASLTQVQAGLQALLDEADAGIVYREGIRTAIVGRPNVGKSSLLNALLRVQRAIVTPVPGTTRDTLEETLNVRGVPLVLVDTAGLRPRSQDLVEQLGMERSRAALAGADLVLWVVDASEPLTEADRAIARLVEGKPALVVLNKCDLSEQTDAAELLPTCPHLRISALYGTGLETLEEAILNQVLGGAVREEHLPRVSQVRHREFLRQALEHVQEALQAHEEGLPADFLCIDLSGALHALGQITGETVSEDLLQTIFSQFCLGK
ncbi:MAG: tRNA uridine-5-carboxymethylaminomethyl(34) synthesis GTPase MnmE [Anaerolineae bacterium]